jgi:hypothetical protein
MCSSADLLSFPRELRPTRAPRDTHHRPTPPTSPRGSHALPAGLALQ